MRSRRVILRFLPLGLVAGLLGSVMVWQDGVERRLAEDVNAAPEVVVAEHAVPVVPAGGRRNRRPSRQLPNRRRRRSRPGRARSPSSPRPTSSRSRCSASPGDPVCRTTRPSRSSGAAPARGPSGPSFTRTSRTRGPKVAARARSHSGSTRPTVSPSASAPRSRRFPVTSRSPRSTRDATPRSRRSRSSQPSIIRRVELGGQEWRRVRLADLRARPRAAPSSTTPPARTPTARPTRRRSSGPRRRTT